VTNSIERNKVLVVFHFFSSSFVIFYALVRDRRSFFTFRNTKCFEITSQQYLYTPVAHFSPHPSCQRDPSQRQELSYLRSYGQTLRHQRTTGKTHRQSWARTGCVRKVALELEEHPGMVGLVFAWRKVWGVQIGWVCFFFFTIYALGLMQIVVVDE
jgi:hypothetical protein